MPAPKLLESSNEQYSEMRTAAATFNETNDCAVVAVAVATGTPYAVVHEMFQQRGRKTRRGTPMQLTEAVVAALGFKMTRVPSMAFINTYPGKKKFEHKCVTTHHPERYRDVWANGQTFLFRTKAHILAVVNGVNVDWTRGKAKRVVNIYLVEKA